MARAGSEGGFRVQGSVTTRHAERYAAKHLGTHADFGSRDPSPSTAQDDDCSRSASLGFSLVGRHSIRPTQHRTSFNFYPSAFILPPSSFPLRHPRVELRVDAQDALLPLRAVL